jgi:hypothetical protein
MRRHFAAHGALMTLHYRPTGVPDYSLADVVVQKLRERAGISDPTALLR